MNSFFRKYQEHFEDSFLAEIKEISKTANKLKLLLQYSWLHQLNIYILIDEYDNFANTILSIFRYFFNVLKGFTSGSGEKNVRLFITGVSPITMDDVTSGFNIGRNISLLKNFNSMIGFTESEVRDMLTYYRTKEVFPLEVEETMVLMKRWYNKYRFAKKSSESIFNSNMVLYFIDQVIQEESFETDTILQIEGQLIARGTENNRIRFTSNRSNPGSGDWSKISFSGNSVDAFFDGEGNYVSGSVLQSFFFCDSD